MGDTERRTGGVDDVLYPYTARVVYAPALTRPYVAYAEDLLNDRPEEAADGYHLGGAGDSPGEAIGHLERTLEAWVGRRCHAVRIRYELEPMDDAREGL